MKNLFFRIILWSIFLVPSFTVIYAQDGATFLKPSAIEVLSPQERLNFTVSTSIKNYDKAKGHYWVVITSIKTAETYFWADVQKNRKGVLSSIENWELDLFWPKFYIKNDPNTGHVFDGGKNPKPSLEPMMLLVIKVDDSLNSFLTNWFQNAKPNYEGIPISKLKKSMIIGQRAIFFE